MRTWCWNLDRLLEHISSPSQETTVSLTNASGMRSVSHSLQCLKRRHQAMSRWARGHFNGPWEWEGGGLAPVVTWFPNGMRVALLHQGNFTRLHLKTNEIRSVNYFEIFKESETPSSSQLILSLHVTANSLPSSLTFLQSCTQNQMREVSRWFLSRNNHYSPEFNQ